jgi:hypothetical protein
MDNVIVKLVKYIDSEWTVGQKYSGIDDGAQYVITDNTGGRHPFIKTGKMMKHFEVVENGED